jgi:hypothetical protein
MTEKSGDLRPPRELRGRRARTIWRAIAPIASANGSLSVATAPLLMILCSSLAKVYDEPDHVFEGELRRMKDLAHAFGILKK